MSVGTIETYVFTDIANAIRVQNGTAEEYKPREMAAAVTALDGTKVGEPGVGVYLEAEQGLISSGVFADIAEAIRGQNGLSETYKPREMAAAILALTWPTGPKVWALLLEGGMMEFCCRPTASSELGEVLQAWEVDPAGYEFAPLRPWDDVKAEVVSAVFDEDFADAEVERLDYWFHGFTSLVDVSGIENVQAVVSCEQMFTSCGSLVSLYATEFEPAALGSGALMFYGCDRLVGGQGFVPDNATDEEAFCLGEDGVLTDPNADGRAWLWGHVYADGLLTIGPSAVPEAGRELSASGRVCVTARYVGVGSLFWSEHAGDVTAVEVLEGSGVSSFANLDYWFYGFDLLASVTGLSSLPAPREMRYAMNGCTSLTSLDLRGVEPSGLTDLTNCFSGCAELETIWADADWALPADATGQMTFFGCVELVGGQGTEFSPEMTSCEYMRIDDRYGGAPGYLTAG